MHLMTLAIFQMHGAGQEKTEGSENIMAAVGKSQGDQ